MKNNKGFSLVEILVTVGLIGLLVSIAIPSYNGYRRNTVKMAMKADVGSGHKAYNAKYAIDSSFCHPFSAVGLSTDRDSNAIYKNKGFFGFGGLATGADVCSGFQVSEVQFISGGTGVCNDGTNDTNHDTKQSCEAVSGHSWTAHSATAGRSAAACTLGTNNFKLGAYTNVSNLNTIIQATDDGKITEHETKVDCQ